MSVLRGVTLRDTTAFTVTIGSGSPTSEAFDMRHYSLATITLPSGTTGFGLGFNVGTAGGTLGTLKDRSNGFGTDVTCVLPTSQLVASHTTPMPGYVFAAERVQLFIHNLTGSGIPQTSARVCTVVLKA